MKTGARKIKRRIWYEVSYYPETGDLISKTFHTIKNTKKYVRALHKQYSGLEIDIARTFLYREHQPRHRTYYFSLESDKFILSERW